MLPRTTRDVAFASRPTGELLLDLYRPAIEAPVPVIVWLHGGGWFTGDRSLAPDLASHAEAIGAAIASIEYRLSGEALFPAQIVDVRDAVRHLRANAADLGIDADRVGLWGSSAGAHLAALAGVTAHISAWPGNDVGAAATTDDLSVQAVMAAYPPVDLERCVRDALAFRPDADPAGFPESRLLGGPPRLHQPLARSASPLTHIGAAGELPPFLIAHGTSDPAVGAANSEMLHEALVAAGGASELFLLDGYKHGFLNPGGRMEAGLSAVMDDGRLEREGTAAARARTADGDERDALFGFDTIHRFFRTALGIAA